MHIYGGWSIVRMDNIPMIVMYRRSVDILDVKIGPSVMMTTTKGMVLS